jgi:hypothetical protein
VHSNEQVLFDVDLISVNAAEGGMVPDWYIIHDSLCNMDAAADVYNSQVCLVFINIFLIRENLLFRISYGSANQNGSVPIQKSAAVTHQTHRLMSFPTLYFVSTRRRATMAITSRLLYRYWIARCLCTQRQVYKTTPLTCK